MTIIITDTTSSLPLDLAARLGISMVPQLVIFGEQTYRDDTEITTEQFLEKLKGSSSLPKTAAPLHTMYLPIFEQAARTNEPVLVIAPSAKISGTVRSAETAKMEFPGADIRVIDTLTIAGCLGALAVLAKDLANNNKSPEEIQSTITSLSRRQHTYFLVDTLDYLQRGGRIGLARAVLGNLLQVKPILQIKDGQAAPYDQERTKKRAIERLIDLTCEQIAGKHDARLSVMHIDAEDEAKHIQKELSARLELPTIPIYILPAAIVVHAGPKALAVGFFA